MILNVWSVCQKCSNMHRLSNGACDLVFACWRAGEASWHNYDVKVIGIHHNKKKECKWNISWVSKADTGRPSRQRVSWNSFFVGWRRLWCTRNIVCEWQRRNTCKPQCDQTHNRLWCFTIITWLAGWKQKGFCHIIGNFILIPIIVNISNYKSSR